VDSTTPIGAVALGLLYVPFDYLVPRNGLLALWRRHLVATAAVRTGDYMKALFASRFPGSALAEVTDGKIPEDVLIQAQTIVLLYPDAIGMEFGWIERALARRWPSKHVLALNGRRRLFRLDREMRRRLAIRRFLEFSRLPELAFFLVFAVVTPFFALLDIMRGHR